MRTLIMVAAVLISGARLADGNPLAGEFGRTRPLIVIAPGAGDELASEVRRALADPAAAAAFAERQIVVYTVIGGQGAREGEALDAGATAALLQALGARADGPGAVLLVGKDGGVKLRLTRLAVAEILGAVDQMPMRRQEVRRP